MSDPGANIVNAAITKLRATAGLTSLVSTRIHKALPTTPTFPCLTVRMVVAVPWDDKADSGQETTLAVDTWTRSERDADDANAIMAQVHAALHQTSLTVSGQNHVLTRMVSRVGPDMDPDGATLHGTQTFRILTQ